MHDADLEHLLSRPAVIAAVRDLGVASLSLEDVLSALHGFGAVRIVVDNDAEQPYVCLLRDGEERGRGRTVLHAAVACWAGALEGLSRYTAQGVDEIERFLLGSD
ncbi:hypothetical protein DVA67_007315 [Solirubrobacter sp. CPCC 204708]|uniref:Uncharacterized protein n=1 Tax=Solirubrobacter deserti TaxID=2282478 RepID=A0ABT4RK01_9ACTN|nr:hypothetical protein [Solirubrobacter deserti]MBE2315779.1 hypothetical protein [Solirubrobacter deserti]MDA0138884.1 hypothetical protein [Solirubrobacter deserti]